MTDHTMTQREHLLRRLRNLAGRMFVEDNMSTLTDARAVFASAGIEMEGELLTALTALVEGLTGKQQIEIFLALGMSILWRSDFSNMDVPFAGHVDDI